MMNSRDSHPPQKLLRDVQDKKNQILVSRGLATRDTIANGNVPKEITLYSVPRTFTAACSGSVHYVHPPNLFAGTKALSFSFERACALLLKEANFQKLR
jgi:hypothetical protein